MVLYLLKTKLVPWSVVLTQWNAILAIRICVSSFNYFFQLHYWNEHFYFIVKNATKRLYSLRVLRKDGVQQPDLVRIYCSLIQSVLEYGTPVWSALPGYLTNVIESVQRRALIKDNLIYIYIYIYIFSIITQVIIEILALSLAENAPVWSALPRDLS